MYWSWYCSGVYATLDDAAALMTKLGGGTDIHINDTWAVTLELTYVMPFEDLSDVKYTTFAWGLRYAF